MSNIIPFPMPKQRLTGTIRFIADDECEFWLVYGTPFGELKDAIEYALDFNNEDTL